MNIIIIFVVTTYLQNIQHAENKLIKICAIPWESYRISGTIRGHNKLKRCSKLCSGHSFYDNERNLICFNEKDVAHFKFRKDPERKNNSKHYVCDCGCTISSQRRWLSCDTDNFKEMSRTECKELCEGTTIYLYKRRNSKMIVHCERRNNSANEFFNLVGELGDLLEHTKSDNITREYSECTCGINSKMTIRMSDEVKHEDDKNGLMVRNFEECSHPWKILEIQQARTVQSCLPYCHRICKKGRGFYYQGSPLCYHHKSPTKKKTEHLGGKKHRCECGYVKGSTKKNEEGIFAINERVFVDCEPRISHGNVTSAKECDSLCGKSFAFVHQTSYKPLDVRCIKNANFAILKPQKLLEKCQVFVREIHPKKYTICSCGLNSIAKSSKLQIPFDTNGIDLPDAWPVKKKRSRNLCGKLEPYEKIKQLI